MTFGAKQVAPRANAVPQLFLAGSVSEEITAINFVADTLLFAGTMLLITKAILDSEPQPAAATSS
jgi:hypothetical protein